MSCTNVSNLGKVWKGWGFRGALALFALILLAAMVLVPVAPVLAANWSHYATITIDDAKVPSTQTNFPVLVSLTDNSLRTTGNSGNVGQDDGGDFVFTDDGNTVKYDHEIESYTPSTGALVAWVRIPTLNGSGSGDTIIRMWYGNAGCENQWNPTGVWDANYVGVWHLPDGTTLGANDLTANANNGSILGPIATTGQIDGAGSFDGIDDYIRIPDSDRWNLTASDGTISVWFYVDTMPAIAGGLVNQINNDQNWAVYYCGDGSIRVGKAGINKIESAGGVVSSGQWYNAVVVKSAGTTTIYVNTVNVASNTTAVWTDSSNPLRIGGHTYTGIPYYVDGTIDEVRFSSTARSVGWIQTEYNNQSDTTIEAGHFITSVVYGTSAPVDPVPELPTIILISVGLTILGGYLWLRRRRRGLSAA